MELNMNDVYIERCDKETEEIIAKEDASVLKTPVKQLKQKRNEFLYIESAAFEPIKVDAISLELDDVFETYMALLGLKVQKKFSGTIKTYLEENLHTTELKNYSALFSGEDGLWDLNIPLDYIKGFSEEMTIEQALSVTYNFLLQLVQAIEQE